MINKSELVIILVMCFAIGTATVGLYGRINADLLPPVGQWTNCRNLPEVCDFPEWESQNLSDIVIYRFENGSMIGQYIGDSPLEK